MCFLIVCFAFGLSSISFHTSTLLFLEFTSFNPSTKLSSINKMAKPDKKKVKKAEKSKPSSSISPAPKQKATSTPTKYACDVEIAPSQLECAVAALRKFAADKAKVENMLFDGDNMPVNLLFALNSVPKKQKRVPHLVKLPHPLFNDESEVCLITADPQRKFKDMLEAEPVPAIKKIIGCDIFP